MIRAVTAVAALLSAAVLQTGVLGPALLPLPVSLPLVVVLSAAVIGGPSIGITLGFGAGLLADLDSSHPAGVLAAIWLGAGLAGGRLGALVEGTRARAVLVGALGALASAIAVVVLAALDSSPPAGALLARTVPAGLLDAALALGVVPVVAAVLRSPALCRPAPPAPLRPAALPRLPVPGP